VDREGVGKYAYRELEQDFIFYVEYIMYIYLPQYSTHTGNTNHSGPYTWNQAHI
jgi:hypothetical protein